MEGTQDKIGKEQAARHYSELIEELAELQTETEDGELTVGELLDRLQESGFTLIGLVLTLPFLQPVPLGPFGTAVGFALVAIGWQSLRGKEKPWVPERLARMHLRGKVWRTMLDGSLRLLKFCRKFCKPALPSLVEGTSGRRYVSSLILTGALLMCIPLVAVPFNNTFPALIIFFACLADLEKDGRMILVSLLWVVATLIFFSFIAVGTVAVGSQLWIWLQGLWSA